MGWSPLPKTASECQSGECKFPLMREAATIKATTIGIDLAKHLFQLHGVDQHGKTVLKRQLKRDQIHGARAVLRVAERKTEYAESWLAGVMERRNHNVTVVALVNKNARIIWALLAHERDMAA